MMRSTIIISSLVALSANTVSAQDIRPDLAALLHVCNQSVALSSPDPLDEIGIVVENLGFGLMRYEGDVVADGHQMGVRVSGGSQGLACAFRLNRREIAEQPLDPQPTLDAWAQALDQPGRETYFDPEIDGRVYFVCDADIRYRAVVFLRPFDETERRRASGRGIALTDDAVAVEFHAEPMSGEACAALNERLDTMDLRGT